MRSPDVGRPDRVLVESTRSSLRVIRSSAETLLALASLDPGKVCSIADPLSDLAHVLSEAVTSLSLERALEAARLGRAIPPRSHSGGSASPPRSGEDPSPVDGGSP